MSLADQTELKSLLEDFAPQSILAIGPAAVEFFADYLSAHPDCRIERIESLDDPARLDALGRYDLAFVSHTLEQLDHAQAGMVISKLRDLHSRRLLVVVPIGPDWPNHQSRWEMNDLLGYGLVRVAAYDYQGRPVQVYAFDIDTYKTTPDWLNAKYWAHPELFDKYWW